MATSRTKETQHREISSKRGVPEANKLFPDNYISTGKYTALTILPKNLFEQFHRVANIWFLIVSFFQVLPLQLSPTSSWATVSPLSIILTLTLLKDAYLDFRRHRSDRLLNNRPAQIWVEREKKVQDRRWKDVQVGNFILLQNTDPIPADVVILCTSEKEGFAYAQTANLDGESNLKVKAALGDTAGLFEAHSPEGNFEMLYKLDDAVLKCEHPNNRLYTFEGSLKIKGHPRATPIESMNVLLRGSTLRNTKWVLGFVVYTGVNTKLMMNSKTPPHKRSNVERRVNKYLSMVFTILFLAASVSTLISVGFSLTHEVASEYFAGQEATFALLNFITFMILYNSLVPISLYVTMDLIRIFQAQFIQWDLRMYHAAEDQPAVAKTGDLNEDLGQIEYIFSDKTGTLTENQMEFKRCSIAGQLYGTMEPPSELLNHEDVSINAHPKFKFYDQSFIDDLDGSHSEELHSFLECLSLCHTVVAGKTAQGETTYQATSPDEEALVIAASALGYNFQFTKNNQIIVDVMGERRQYEVTGYNEFTSERRRMSIVVRNVTDTGSPHVLYCKGADEAILPRVQATQSAKALIQQHLTEFSVEGLRTLLLAKRQLTQAEASEFERK